jgi:hypothetical protein
MRHPTDLSERLRTFLETKRLGDFGQFHLISAYEQDGTVFIDFTPGEGVRIDTLLPSGGQDAPGEDLRGVRRPAGLQRLLTIEHGEGPTWSRTWIYRAGDGGEAVAEFRRAFVAAGWTEGPLRAPQVAHFSDNQHECFIGGSGTGGNSAVVLVYRNLTGSDTQS